MEKKDYTILIIEDDYYVRELYLRVLKATGFNVFTAANGQEGFQLATQHQPNLVLLDIMLPGKNGLAVLRQLKDDDQTKSTSIIVLTNLGQESIIKDAMSAGAEAFFLKPEVDPYELAKRIDDFYEKKVTQPTSE
jgi:CheY-like chemotaxis protein